MVEFSLQGALPGCDPTLPCGRSPALAAFAEEAEHARLRDSPCGQPQNEMCVQACAHLLHVLSKIDP